MPSTDRAPAPGLLDGKVAVITGAGSGVGRASALRFSEQGARVVCGDLRAAWVDETVRLVRERGGEAHAFSCDVAREDDVKSLLAEAVTQYGGLDIVFNNAGMTQPGLGIGDHQEELLRRFMEVNVLGVLFGCKHGVEIFRQQGRGGSIVNTSSVSGLVAFGGVGYGATKGAVSQLTKTLAVEVGRDGIRVNAVCPGSMFTNIDKPESRAFQTPTEADNELLANLDPLRIAVTPEHVADAALFLASDLAAAITGVLLPVDGGFVAGVLPPAHGFEEQ